jgi:PhnB protein
MREIVRHHIDTAWRQFHNLDDDCRLRFRAADPPPRKTYQEVSMSKQVKPVPDGYATLTANLVCQNAARAIEFYKTAFGATELRRAPGPHGEILHAELQIGDSKFFINDTMSKTPGPTSGQGVSNPMYIHMYVPDADSLFDRAVKAGARVDMPIQDMFWGDRYGKITDPFGQQWGIATHKEDVAPEDMKRRQDAFFAKAAGQN